MNYFVKAEAKPCVMLDKTTKPDGEGGFTADWSEGAPFDANIRFDSSMQARIAEKQGVTSLYTVITSKSVKLEYHDVFKRLEDGKIFRVTSDGDDQCTPDISSLDMRIVSAEEWRLTR